MNWGDLTVTHRPEAGTSVVRCGICELTVTVDENEDADAVLHFLDLHEHLRPTAS
ncbi:MAG TPA: hypothetical protein VNG13_01420 [Mycobacteriales bacterium]|nr:hypothetical protein [Mycobacteriales bacterium]